MQPNDFQTNQRIKHLFCERLRADFDAFDLAVPSAAVIPMIVMALKDRKPLKRAIKASFAACGIYPLDADKTLRVFDQYALAVRDEVFSQHMDRVVAAMRARQTDRENAKMFRDKIVAASRPVVKRFKLSNKFCISLTSPASIACVEMNSLYSEAMSMNRWQLMNHCLEKAKMPYQMLLRDLNSTREPCTLPMTEAESKKSKIYKNMAQIKAALVEFFNSEVVKLEETIQHKYDERMNTPQLKEVHEALENAMERRRSSGTTTSNMPNAPDVGGSSSRHPPHTGPQDAEPDVFSGQECLQTESRSVQCTAKHITDADSSESRATVNDAEWAETEMDCEVENISTPDPKCAGTKRPATADEMEDSMARKKARTIVFIYKEKK